MAECFSCGISGEGSLLNEAIYKTGVVLVCKNCSEKFNLPLIEKKKIDWKKVDESGTVRDRLADMTRAEVSQTRFAKPLKDVKLRDLVEENLKKNVVKLKENPNDLIDNFHWEILRRRRILGITRGKFAEGISEPESLVRSLEGGGLPDDYTDLILKVEKFLSVSLFKRKVEDVEVPRDVDDLDVEIGEESGNSFFSKFWGNVKESFRRKAFDVEDLEYVDEAMGDTNSNSVKDSLNQQNSDLLELSEDSHPKQSSPFEKLNEVKENVVSERSIRTIDYRERLAKRARERAEEMRRIRREREEVKGMEKRAFISEQRSNVSRYSGDIAKKNAVAAEERVDSRDYEQKRIDKLKEGVLGKADNHNDVVESKAGNRVVEVEFETNEASEESCKREMSPLLNTPEVESGLNYDADKEFDDVIGEARNGHDEVGESKIGSRMLRNELVDRAVDIDKDAGFESVILDEDEYSNEEPDYERDCKGTYEKEIKDLNPVERSEDKQSELDLGEDLDDDDIHRIAWGGK
jgi:ribosome-binding protein aMBF1 (putative translation factor)